MFILAVFFLAFFFLIYVFLGITIKMYFFFFSGNLLSLFKYLDVLNISLDKAMYYNLVIKKNFIETLLKNKTKSVVLFNLISNEVKNFLFSRFLNAFLVLRRNLFKIQKNRKFLFFCNKFGVCEIIL